MEEKNSKVHLKYLLEIFGPPCPLRLLLRPEVQTPSNYARVSIGNGAWDLRECEGVGRQKPDCLNTVVLKPCKKLILNQLKTANLTNH